MGQVLTAGAGQIPARQAAVAGGIPMDVPALTINKVCLSGIDAIALADQLIRAGEFDIVVAGGQESMTQAPHLLGQVPRGLQVRRRHDGRPHGLRRPVLRVRPGRDGCLDGEVQRPLRADPRGAGRVLGALAPAGRRRGGERHLRRRDRAGADPAAQGRPGRCSPPTRASAATPPSRASRKLRPAFASDGTITAGSASQISDGAAAVVVMSKAKAEELGLSWLAEIGAHGVVAGPDASLHEQPANAIAKACAKEGIEPGRPGPRRDQRGVRRRRDRVDAQAGHRRGEGQRQRRGHRAGPPDRHVRRPDRAAPGAGAEAPGWRRSAWPRSAAAAARATR